MELKAQIQAVFEAVDRDDVEGAVLGSIRVARAVGDHLSAATFMREVLPDAKGVVRALYDDWKNLKKESIDFMMKRSGEIWLDGRTLDYSLGDDERGEELKVMGIAVGDMDHQLRQWGQSAQELVVPPGMAPYDTAAFSDQYARRRDRIRFTMNALHTIRQRLKARCFNYAVTIERQLEAQQRPVVFMHRMQAEVNSYFRARAPEVHAMLEKAAQLVGSPDTEDQSLLLTQVRRATKAAADHFFPARAGKVRCADGVERELNDDKYLNRLQEFVASTFARSAANDLLRAEAEYLVVFSRRLNELASKGVHAQVTVDEARQGLLGLYMFLYNVISKLQAVQPRDEGT